MRSFNEFNQIVSIHNAAKTISEFLNEDYDFHPSQKVKYIHGKDENDEEIGFSAQAYAAAEIYTKITELKNKLPKIEKQIKNQLLIIKKQKEIEAIQPEMKKLLNVIKSASASFPPGTDGSETFLNALHVLYTSFPSKNDLLSVYDWCRIVLDALKDKMKTLNRAKTVDQQHAALSTMHEPFKATPLAKNVGDPFPQYYKHHKDEFGKERGYNKLAKDFASKKPRF